MSKTIIFDLGEFQSPDSKIFAGHKRGKEFREKLNIQKYENEDTIIEFLIPEDTFSLNPSFFLAFLGKTVKNLGKKEFLRRFKFKCTNEIHENIISGIDYSLKHSSIFN